MRVSARTVADDVVARRELEERKAKFDQACEARVLPRACEALVLPAKTAARSPQAHSSWQTQGRTEERCLPPALPADAPATPGSQGSWRQQFLWGGAPVLTDSARCRQTQSLAKHDRSDEEKEWKTFSDGYLVLREADTVT